MINDSHFYCISFRIEHTSWHLLEQLSPDEAQMRAFSKAALQQFSALESIVMLSTCNRVEIYFFSPTPNLAKPLLFQLGKSTGVAVSLLKKQCKLYSEKEAVQHLFFTTAGLKSLALGETEIQGQVKRAFQFAAKHKFIQTKHFRMFETALRCGKAVRTLSGFREKSLCLSQLAIACAQSRRVLSRAKSAVLIGTGKMAKQAYRCLKENGIGNIAFLSHKPKERRANLAAFNAEVQQVQTELFRYLKFADVVCSAYGTDQTFITTDLVEAVLAERTSAPVIIDIAMPGDVDPNVRKLLGERFINFEDLKAFNRTKHAPGMDDLEHASTIVEQHISEFFAMEKQRRVFKQMQVLPIAAGVV